MENFKIKLNSQEAIVFRRECIDGGIKLGASNTVSACFNAVGELHYVVLKNENLCVLVSAGVFHDTEVEELSYGEFKEKYVSKKEGDIMNKSEMNKMVREMRDGLASQGSQISSLVSMYDNVVLKNSKLDEEIDELKEELVKLNNELGSLDGIVRDNKAWLDRTEDDLDSTVEDISQLRSDVSTLENNDYKWDSELDDLRIQLSKLERANESITLCSSTEGLIELKELVAANDRRYSDVADDLDCVVTDMRDRIEILEEEDNDAETSIDILKNEMSRLKDDFGSFSLDEEVNELKDRVNKVESSIVEIIVDASAKKTKPKTALYKDNFICFTSLTRMYESQAKINDIHFTRMYESLLAGENAVDFEMIKKGNYTITGDLVELPLLD